MCGIFSYYGKKNAANQIIKGLKRLEYRGYDSWGLAVCQNNKISIYKQVGKISSFEQLDKDFLPDSQLGIGHTRWATHGKVSKENAHPHFSTDQSFALAQNGIVQNYQELKTMLQNKNYQFITETDTEVIVRLIEYYQQQDDNLLLAVRHAFQRLEGRNTIILLSNTAEIIAVRNGSPLIVGLNDQDEYFLSSDTLSFANQAKKMVIIDNGQLVHLNQSGLQLIRVNDGAKLDYQVEDLNLVSDVIDKEGFDHFMLKEINETAEVITQLTKQDAQLYRQLAQAIKQSQRIFTIGSGTAGVAAGQIAYYLRKISQVMATPLVGANASEYLPLITADDLVIAPSQSGETADVLEVLEILKQRQVEIAAFVNMQGSSMLRLADFPFLTQAGPEICVVSTKVFSAQIAWGYLLSQTVKGCYQEGVNNLLVLAREIKTYLNQSANLEEIKNLAAYLINKDHIFLLGKAENLNIAQEGMIKIIETSYKHAHTIPAGDLKHYAITLMEKGVPVIIIATNKQLKSEILNAAYEVKARGAEIIGIADQSDPVFEKFIKVPWSGELGSIANVVPLQLLSYYMAISLGNDVDHPRNIAKSVTVK